VARTAPLVETDEKLSAEFFCVSNTSGNLAVGVAFGDGLTAVVLLTSLGQGNLNLGAPVFEVHLERHDGEWLRLGPVHQSDQLVVMH
jgi:hypothetical protein